MIPILPFILLSNIFYFVKGECTEQALCNNDPLYEGQCYVKKTKGNIDQYLYQPCPEGQSCQKDEYGRYVCKEKIYKELYPGLYCNKNEECYSQNCTQNTCIGLLEGKNCTDHRDCHVGLYCNSLTSKCEKQKEIGEECDTDARYNDYDCVNNAGCLQGKCTEYLSLDEGTFVGQNGATSAFASLKVLDLLIINFIVTLKSKQQQKLNVIN